MQFPLLPSRGLLCASILITLLPKSIQVFDPTVHSGCLVTTEELRKSDTEVYYVCKADDSVSISLNKTHRNGSMLTSAEHGITETPIQYEDNATFINITIPIKELNTGIVIECLGYSEDDTLCGKHSITVYEAVVPDGEMVLKDASLLSDSVTINCTFNLGYYSRGCLASLKCNDSFQHYILKDKKVRDEVLLQSVPMEEGCHVHSVYGIRLNFEVDVLGVKFETGKVMTNPIKTNPTEYAYTIILVVPIAIIVLVVVLVKKLTRKEKSDAEDAIPPESAPGTFNPKRTKAPGSRIKHDGSAPAPDLTNPLADSQSAPLASDGSNLEKNRTVEDGSEPVDKPGSRVDHDGSDPEPEANPQRYYRLRPRPSDPKPVYRGVRKREKQKL